MNPFDTRLLVFPLLLLLAACSSVTAPAGSSVESLGAEVVSTNVSVTEVAPPTASLPAAPILESPAADIPSPAATTQLPVSHDQTAPIVDQSPDSESADQELAPVILPISVYIIAGQEEGLSSQRQPEQLAGIYELVNEIYSPAGITIEVQHINRITLPDATIQAIVRGDFQPFFDGAGRDFDVPDPSPLNAFYARDIGGPNGIVPFNARLFFVMDEPSVHHERVSSHEIGHILGLHHTRNDPGRLMFSGTNGMALTDEEITVARYTLQGILDRLR